jgi:hypothetical protein
MELQIAALVADETVDAELRDLHQWLLRERPRAGQIGLVDAPLRNGEMGAATEALQVALASGGALSVLAGSVTTWLSTRRQQVAVRITREDGESLELNATTTNPQEALEKFLEFASSDD